ncbi:melanopsin-A-like [Pundamilia nyererei]|uniref:Opsin 4b n=2 Tax=Haplochromini TaxID=319058 RepID=A0A3Q3BWZ8_HAPBU|nr:PREDICTED: melanopsin-A-like [Pundamilia nyererei]XP_005943965.1 melanopsin-A isoform X1 [Haplochromis burtoni]XP_039895249.1 melanopsin-A-like [Simochromis diagramma]
MDSKLLIGPVFPTPDPTSRTPWNITSISPRRPMELSSMATTGSMVRDYPFPTVDVPDHAHYTIGVVILAVGITGLLGNFLVIYAFCRSRSLRTPSNIFIINLAVTDFLMCLTQTPIFFINSMHKHWIFGKKGCELYAFCGALFGICSMITLMVIAVDRYVVITRPLASLGVMSRKKAFTTVAVAWLYSVGWSLPPFFGWSAYVPEGLMTSCSWDYMTFTPSVRSYTMLLFTFVFFIPLFVIIFCYCCIFRAIRHTTRAITKINCEGTRDSAKRFHKMRSEWRMAKIALIVILLFVISWAPYSCTALTAFAGYADLLTPYMNSVPAVIAKASAIHNPIIYAITHPKYRSAISRYVPYLGVLLCMKSRDRFSSSSFQSIRRSTLTSQSEFKGPSRTHNSSQSESESAQFSDTEEDYSSRTPVSRHLSGDAKQVRHASQRSKVRGYNTEYERTSAHNATDPAICHLSPITALTEPEGISMSDISLQPTSNLPASLDNVMRESGPRTVCKTTSSVIVTSISSPSILHSPPGYHGNFKLTKSHSPVAKETLDIAMLETTALP